MRDPAVSLVGFSETAPQGVDMAEVGHESLVRAQDAAWASRESEEAEEERKELRRRFLLFY